MTTRYAEAWDCKRPLEVSPNVHNFCIVKLTKKAARNAIALFIAMLVAVLIYMKTGSSMLATSSLPVTLLILFFIGLASIFPIVVMILVVVAWLVYTVISGRGGSVPEG